MYQLLNEPCRSTDIILHDLQTSQGSIDVLVTKQAGVRTVLELSISVPAIFAVKCSCQSDVEKLPMLPNSIRFHSGVLSKKLQ